MLVWDKRGGKAVCEVAPGEFYRGDFKAATSASELLAALDCYLTIILPERFFLCTTKRANPVIWNIFPGCPWIDTIGVVSFFRVINIAAWTFPFLHICLHY